MGKEAQPSLHELMVNAGATPDVANMFMSMNQDDSILSMMETEMSKHIETNFKLGLIVISSCTNPKQAKKAQMTFANINYAMQNHMETTLNVMATCNKKHMKMSMNNNAMSMLQ